jgi:hypothetical protein
MTILVAFALATGLALSQPKVRMGQTTTPQPPRPPRGEHLCPEMGVFDPFATPSYSYVAQKLLDGVAAHRFAQMVVTSRIEHAIVIEFAEECMVGPGSTQVTYAAARSSIFSALSAQITAASQNRRVDADRMQTILANLSIPVDVTRAPIDCASAAVLGGVWEAMLRGTRFDDTPRSGPDCSLLMDGTTSHFGAFNLGHQWMSGSTQSPEPKTPAGRLVAIGRALIDYVKAPLPDRERVKREIMSQANSLLADLRQVDGGTTQRTP